MEGNTPMAATNDQQRPDSASTVVDPEEERQPMDSSNNGIARRNKPE